MAEDELIEKVEFFQNLLVSYATGGQVTDSEFRSLREELIAEPRLRDRLPRFVRTVRDLNQFWPYNIAGSLSIHSTHRTACSLLPIR